MCGTFLRVLDEVLLTTENLAPLDMTDGRGVEGEAASVGSVTDTRGVI